METKYAVSLSKRICHWGRRYIIWNQPKTFQGFFLFSIQ